MNGRSDVGPIHVSGGVSGLVASGTYVYQVQAPGGEINQFIGVDPIRARTRPSFVRPRRIPEPIGRGELIRRTLQALQTEPVQLHAGDGWGKSTILKHVVRDTALEAWTDGVVFVSGFGRTIEDLEQDIFDAFFDSTPQVRATSSLLRAHLRDVVSVIAVDDADLSAQHIERLLDDVPMSAFVISSRERTLTNATTLPIAGLATPDAVGLFERALGRALTAVELPSIERYAGVCSGKPQALRIAAGTVGRGTVTIAELGDCTAVEQVVARLRPGLSSEELRALETLAVVAGSPLPSSALEELLPEGEVEAILERLRDDGLLLSASPRFWLPRDTAEQLGLGTRSVESRRLVLLKGLAGWAGRERDPRELVAAGPALVRLAEQLITIEPYGVIELARRAHAGYAVTAQWGLWRRLLEASLTSARSLQEEFDTAWALHELGSHSLLVGDRGLAAAQLREALTLREQLGDIAGARVTRHNLDLVTGAIGRQRWRRTLRRLLVIAVVAVIGVLAIGLVRALIDRIGDEDDEDQLILGVPEIDFGEVPSGESRETSVSITNTAATPIDIVEVRIDAPFRVEHGCGQVEPGSSCVVLVGFTAPPQLGSVAAELVVAHHRADDEVSESTIPVRGASVERSNVALEASPLQVDFGVVDIADGLVAADVTLTNTGNTAVELSLALDEGVRFLFASECAVLGPGETCVATVGFAASDDAGQFTDVLHIEDGSGQGSLDVLISATVARPPPEVVEIAVVPTEIAFGEVRVGDVVEGRLDIANTGEGATEVALGFSDGSPFDIAAVDCGVLEPQRSCGVTVQFVAGESGEFADVLRVEYMPGDGQIDVPVSAEVPVPADLESEITGAGTGVPRVVGQSDHWVIPIVVEIRNSGGLPVDEPFRLTVETGDEREPILLPAGNSEDSFNRVLWNSPIDVQRTSEMEIFVAFDARLYKLGQEVTIRVHADSCAGEEIEVPPCRVVEVSETNNGSGDFTFTIEEEPDVD